MKVLLSIRPEFVSRIFNGTKRFEYRRNIFRAVVERVIVYATSPTKLVVGEFEIEDILFDELDTLWFKTRHHSGLTEKHFYSYFTDLDKGYAIKIGKVSEYKTPLSLQHCYGLHPPQSFLYLK